MDNLLREGLVIRNIIYSLVNCDELHIVSMILHTNSR